HRDQRTVIAIGIRFSRRSLALMLLKKRVIQIVSLLVSGLCTRRNLCAVFHYAGSTVAESENIVVTFHDQPVGDLDLARSIGRQTQGRKKSWRLDAGCPHADIGGINLSRVIDYLPFLNPGHPASGDDFYLPLPQ